MDDRTAEHESSVFLCLCSMPRDAETCSRVLQDEHLFFSGNKKRQKLPPPQTCEEQASDEMPVTAKVLLTRRIFLSRREGDVACNLHANSAAKASIRREGTA